MELLNFLFLENQPLFLVKLLHFLTSFVVVLWVNIERLILFIVLICSLLNIHNF